MLTADLRPLPELVVVGVKRGGTTSVFRALEQHPAMCPLVPSARRLPLRENMKGVHYFDTNGHRSARWYRSHFPTGIARRVRARRAGAAFAAEASPYYFFHPLAAGRAAEALPDRTVFVVMLRDPVERTVSHWAEQTRNGVEHLSLVDALDAEPGRLGDDADRLTVGAIEASHAHEQQSYAAQSFYAASLRRWFDAVGRDRVVVLFAEDYNRDPAATIDRIVTAIGVPAVAAAPSEHRNAAARSGALDAALDEQLTERFRSDVDEVAELLGVEPPWPRFTRSSPTPNRPMTPR